MHRGRTSCLTFTKRKFDVCWSQVWLQFYFCLTLWLSGYLQFVQNGKKGPLPRKQRSSHYDGDKLISFVDGFVTDDADLTDEMYENAAMHNENGAWQMIFGVNTLPAYRQHGYAGELLQKAIADAKEQDRKGLVLTCKDRLVPYYAKFGFVDEGVTDKSTHGNVAWHQMRLTF